MSDTVLIVNCLVGAASAAFTAWVGYLILRLKAGQDKAQAEIALKVEEVKVAALAAETAARKATSDAALEAEKVRSTLQKTTLATDRRLTAVSEGLSATTATQSSDSQDLKEAVRALDAKVEEVHRATNSLTDRLVESTAKESHAAGRAEGIASQKKEGVP